MTEEERTSLAREIASINRDLKKLSDQWEPPTARELLWQMTRLASALQEASPEPDPWDAAK